MHESLGFFFNAIFVVIRAHKFYGPPTSSRLRVLEYMQKRVWVRKKGSTQAGDKERVAETRQVLIKKVD
jgi:hypothetical protein